MTDTLIRLLTENATNIILTVLTTISSSLLYYIAKAKKQMDKTEQDIGEVKHHVNGSLSRRLANMTLDILTHLDVRLDSIENRFKGLEARIRDVEDQADECTKERPPDA